MPKDTAPPERAPASAPEIKPDPLDHDGNGHKGGSAAPPERQPLVITADAADRGLVRGEVILVTPAAARTLLHADVARTATDTEVELAQPRVRFWNEG